MERNRSGNRRSCSKIQSWAAQLLLSVPLKEVLSCQLRLCVLQLQECIPPILPHGKVCLSVQEGACLLRLGGGASLLSGKYHCTVHLNFNEACHRKGEVDALKHQALRIDCDPESKWTITNAKELEEWGKEGQGGWTQPHGSVCV